MDIRFRTLDIFLFFLCLLHFNTVSAQTGESLPPWQEGYLDIHAINTGKGECTFFIFPDGTTLLVDAGAALNPKPWAADPKPDSSRTPGEWISRYISHMLGAAPHKKLNYMMISHFHWDHMGGYSDAMKTSRKGGYKLSGITEVGENISFDKMIDRGWPDYNWPVPLDDEKMVNYRKFLQWQMKHHGVTVEQFRVGRNDQIILANHPERYPQFEVRNIAANGKVWTGCANNVRNHFPSLEYLDENEFPSENKCSIAFRLSYGNFDYFTGGDIDVRDADVGSALDQWKDIETPIAMVTGPVDVCKANHHANYDANSVSFWKYTRPRVIIVHSWGASQPAMGIYRRMISPRTYPGPRDIYVTNIMKETRTAFNVDKLKSQQGHIIVRVMPGGDRYNVYVLDDSDERYTVKAVHGPYKSR